MSQRYEPAAVIQCLVALAAAFLGPGPIEAGSRSEALLENHLLVDLPIVGGGEVNKARRVADAWGDTLEDCEAPSQGAARESCLVDRLVAGGQLLASDGDQPRGNSITGALVDGRGTCAALVGLVLALGAEHRIELRAVVLDEHVVVASVAERGRYYDLTRRGAPLSETDLRRFRSAARPVTVSAERYLAFYMDNLAVRLSESGEGDEAEWLFLRAIEQAREDGRIRYNYGTHLLAEGRAAEALRELTLAVRGGWKTPSSLMNRGVALGRVGRVREARRSFRRALRLDPTSLEAAQNLRRLEAEP